MCNLCTPKLACARQSRPKNTVQAEEFPKKGPTLPTGITVLEFFHDHLLKITTFQHQYQEIN